MNKLLGREPKKNHLKLKVKENMKNTRRLKMLTSKSTRKVLQSYT